MTAPRADTVRWRGDRRGPRTRHMHLEDLAVDSSRVLRVAGSSLVSLELCRAVCVLAALCARRLDIPALVRIYLPFGRTEKGNLQSSSS